MTDKLVIDASPLIVLIKSGLDNVLRSYPAVSITESVYQEIMAGPRDDAARIALPEMRWIEVVSPLRRSAEIEVFGLGRGESDTLTIAFGDKTNVAVIDDSAARRCARMLGINAIGTGGILLRAYRDGQIDSFSEALDAVIDAGLWIGSDLRGLLLDRSKKIR